MDYLKVGGVSVGDNPLEEVTGGSKQLLVWFHFHINCYSVGLK